MYAIIFFTIICLVQVVRIWNVGIYHGVGVLQRMVFEFLLNLVRN
jgi:hypothetical protein